MRWLLVIGMAFGSAASGSAQESSSRPSEASEAATLAALERRIGDLEFSDAPLDQVIDSLEQQSGIDIHTKWQELETLGIAQDKPISLRLRNVRLSQALWLLMNEAGGADVRLGYRLSDGLLVLTTSADLERELVTRVYDVSDLLVRVPRISAPQLDISRSQQVGLGGGQSPFERTSQTREPEPGAAGNDLGASPQMQRLIELIVTTVEPDSWDHRGGKGTIAAHHGVIVVHNSLLVHQKLGGYLPSRN